jgi:hypothetical protein
VRLTRDPHVRPLLSQFLFLIEPPGATADSPVGSKRVLPVVIERKTIVKGRNGKSAGDLQASLESDRFYSQVERMNRSRLTHKVYLVEGDHSACGGRPTRAPRLQRAAIQAVYAGCACRLRTRTLHAAEGRVRGPMLAAAHRRSAGHPIPSHLISSHLITQATWQLLTAEQQA